MQDRTEVLRAGPAAPEQARHMVPALPLSKGVRDAALVVVSELVTNSVRHAGLAAGDPIEVRVTGDERHLSVSVHDGGPGFSQIATNGGSSRGLGLKIVEGLSEAWSVAYGRDGCTVRCAVAGWSASAGNGTKATQNRELRLEEDVAQ